MVMNNFRIAASVRGGTRHARAVAGKRLRLFAAAVKDRNGVPRAEQIARHAHAHSAKSDKCNFHSRQHSDSTGRNQAVFKVAFGFQWRGFSLWVLVLCKAPKPTG